jgi:hydroxyacylglutathione hydrolase
MSSKLIPVRRRGDAARVRDTVDMSARLVRRRSGKRRDTEQMSDALEVSWIHGSKDRRRPTDPPIQVHRYDPDTVLLRQSKDVHFEAPFLFLLIGRDGALLLDTGATEDDQVRRAVDGLLADRPAGYQLVVAHTHGHGDHVAGDAGFAERPDTTVVGRDVEAVRTFFGFADWPNDVVGFDLGDRMLELTGIPGHHPASIAVYDPHSRLLFTGDTVLPGRLYVADMAAYVDSLRRLVEFAEARPVAHVLGCHIEMTVAPGRDYFPGCRYQPHEPPLEMTVGQLRAVREAAISVADRPGVHRFDDFIVYNGMGPLTGLRLNARGLAGLVRSRLVSH